MIDFARKRMRLLKLVAFVGICLLISAASAQPQASFQGLGTSFTAQALSRSGQVVVGSDATDAAYWSAGQIIHLGVGAGSIAYSCNKDGSIIVGQTADGFPFMWTKGGAWQKLPLLTGGTSGQATLISANGATVAGYSDGAAVIWTKSGIYALPCVTPTQLNAISDDGTSVGGDGYANYGYYTGNASPSDVMNGYCNPQYPALFHIGADGSSISSVGVYSYDPYGEYYAYYLYESIFCLTGDGSQGFGGAYHLRGYPIMYWDGVIQWVILSYYPLVDGWWPVTVNPPSSTDTYGIGTNPNTNPGSPNSTFEIHSCSSNGNVLAGRSILWMQRLGIEETPYTQYTFANAGLGFGGAEYDLLQFLTNRGAKTAGWILSNVPTQSVSSDGTTMLGQGTDPQGKAENWMATITPKLCSFTLTASSVYGGSLISGTFAADYPVGTSANVVVVSSNPALVSGMTYTMPPGSMAIPFSLKTKTVSNAVNVVLRATMGSFSQQTSVEINPNPVSKFYLSQSSVVGGTGIRGVVQLSGPAGPEGNSVALSSSSADVTVPSTVTVPANLTGVSFAIQTQPASAVENVTITETFNSDSKQCVLVLSPYAISAFYTAASAVTGGTATRGVIQLAGPAGASGDAVTVSSSAPCVVVPATVTVPQGTRGVSFAISSTRVISSTSVTLTATLGLSTVTTGLTVNASSLSNFYPSPASVTGGTGSTGVVQLTGPAPAGGLTVALASSSGDVSLPASVTFSAGKMGMTFAIHTSRVAVTETVTLTATFGTVSKEAGLTLNPVSGSSTADGIFAVVVEPGMRSRCTPAPNLFKGDL